MTEKAGLPLDMAVFCLQSSVILTFICVIDSNCVRFHSRSSLLAIALVKPLQPETDDCYSSFLRKCMDQAEGPWVLGLRVSKWMLRSHSNSNRVEKSLRMVSSGIRGGPPLCPSAGLPARIKARVPRCDRRRRVST